MKLLVIAGSLTKCWFPVSATADETPLGPPAETRRKVQTVWKGMPMKLKHRPLCLDKHVYRPSRAYVVCIQFNP